MPIEYHNGNPIFLISPPGSLEAAEIGYVNIPKIVDEPPDEIREIHNFTSPEDKKVQSIAKGLIKNDFIVVDRMKYSTRKSNCWIYRPFIESKKASHDLMVPLFPEYLEFSIPWIVCEYGLYCVKNEDRIGLEEFTKNTIGRRMADFRFVGIALLKKTKHGDYSWRKADSNPIYYLRVVAKREKKESNKFEFPDKDTGLFEDQLFADHNADFISFDSRILTGDPIQSLKNTNEGSLEQQLIKDEFFSELFIDNNLEKLSKIQEMEETAKSKGLSEGATQLLITIIQNRTTYADASGHLGMSTKEYNRYRQEIRRFLKSYKSN